MIRFVPYILRSAWRNRVRSTLTVLGVATAVFIVTGLAAILESRRSAVAATPETLLAVSEKDKW
ncbi:MAG: hypothetical protein MUE73_08515 [Planctomycetes bacterium]|jgi:hypothetical protein|nr:hypothetical protein [Planctomycetota bacterium]